MMKICSARCTGCLKRDLAYLSQNNEMDSRSIWVEFPAGADICTFFYAKDGKSMFLLILSKFVIAYTASRHIKQPSEVSLSQTVCWSTRPPTGY